MTLSKDKHNIYLFLALVCLYSLSSCHFGSSTTQEDLEKQATTESAANKAISSAEDLLAANDCAACHQEKESIIGPSYIQIAKRYSSKDISILAEKIIKGGKGNWGETPMTAHPGLSELEATEMVNYILKMK
jgi:cytochrome c